MALTKVIGDGVGVLTTADEGSLKIQTGTTSASFLSFADGDNNRGYVKYDHNDDSLELGVAGESHFKIDSAHILTMDKQPAFLANNSNAVQSDIAASSLLQIAFAVEVFDQNADYNATNSTFTAPVTGRYQFNASVRLDNIDTAASYYLIRFTTSNRNHTLLWQPKYSADPQYFSYTVATLADMDASDTCVVKIYQLGGSQQTDINNDSIFSGYLVA